MCLPYNSSASFEIDNSVDRMVMVERVVLNLNDDCQAKKEKLRASFGKL
jgi:hypothetical protein